MGLNGGALPFHEAGELSNVASYTDRVKSEIHRWQGEGLLAPDLAAALARDIESRRPAGTSLGTVLILLASVLIAAAILLFVAANWEAVPRLVRVLLLFAVMAAGTIGGAVAKMRGSRGLGEALFVVSSATFGASLALVGQMYHLSGDEVQAIGTWGTATALAAALLRSPSLSIGAVLLAAAWMVGTSSGLWTAGSPSAWFLLAVAVLWLLSFWVVSPISRVLLILSVLLYGCLLVLDRGGSPFLSLLIAAGSAFLFAFAVWMPKQAARYAALGSALPVLGLLGFFVGMVLAQVQVDHLAAAFVLAGIVFAGVAVALWAAGRENRRLRRLAYAGFTVELVYLYVQVLGTMLDTASLFLASGFAFALIAVAIRRMERRFAARVEGAAS